jgi:hypothetical protein
VARRTLSLGESARTFWRRMRSQPAFYLQYLTNSPRTSSGSSARTSKGGVVPEMGNERTVNPRPGRPNRRSKTGARPRRRVRIASSLRMRLSSIALA